MEFNIGRGGARVLLPQSPLSHPHLDTLTLMNCWLAKVNLCRIVELQVTEAQEATLFQDYVSVRGGYLDPSPVVPARLTGIGEYPMSLASFDTVIRADAPPLVCVEVTSWWVGCNRWIVSANGNSKRVEVEMVPLAPIDVKLIWYLGHIGVKCNPDMDC